MPLKRKDRQNRALWMLLHLERRKRDETLVKGCWGTGHFAQSERRGLSFFPPTFDSHFLRNVSFFAHKAPVMQAN